MSAFKSVFARHLESYVDMKRALGLVFESQEYYLQKFDQHAVVSKHRGRFTQKLALEYAGAASTKGGIARRYEIIRHFSEFLATVAPGTPVLDRSAMRREDARSPACIFSELEVERLLRGAEQSSKRSALRGLAMRAMIGLAVSCGLRPREVRRLGKGDVDWIKDSLQIRRTKFRKDRIVPLHPSTAGVLREYAERRDAIFPDSGERFFLNAFGRPFAAAALEAAFRDLVRQLGMREPRGRGPTFGDLRHTFAVRRIVAWYREGADVQAKLPVLATFMGHVDYTSTAYYVTTTPELQRLAADRLQHWLDRPIGGAS